MTIDQSQEESESHDLQSLMSKRQELIAELIDRRATREDCPSHVPGRIEEIENTLREIAIEIGEFDPSSRPKKAKLQHQFVQVYGLNTNGPVRHQEDATRRGTIAFATEGRNIGFGITWCNPKERFETRKGKKRALEKLTFVPTIFERRRGDKRHPVDLILEFIAGMSIVETGRLVPGLCRIPDDIEFIAVKVSRHHFVRVQLRTTIIRSSMGWA